MSQNKGLKKFEFDGALLGDIHLKQKGSKQCKTPHTKFSILTNLISNEEMDQLVYGGIYGFKVKLTIEVVEEEKPNVAN